MIGWLLFLCFFPILNHSISMKGRTGSFPKEAVAGASSDRVPESVQLHPGLFRDKQHFCHSYQLQKAQQVRHNLEKRRKFSLCQKFHDLSLKNNFFSRVIHCNHVGLFLPPFVKFSQCPTPFSTPSPSFPPLYHFLTR